MAALSGNYRRLAASDAAAYDYDVLFDGSRGNGVTLFVEQRGVDGAGYQPAVEDARHAAVLAADAGTDVLVIAALGLIGPLRVGETGFAERHGVSVALLDGLLGHFGDKDLARADNGDVDSFLYLLGVLEPETFLLVRGRVEPVEAVVAAAREQQRVGSGGLERLGQLDADVDVTADFLELLAGQRGNADVLHHVAHAQADYYGVILAIALLEALDDVGGDAELAALGKAELVVALVEERGGELVGEVAAVGAADADAVRSRVDRGGGGVKLRVYQAVALLGGEGAAHDAGVPAAGHGGGRDGVAVHHRREGLQEGDAAEGGADLDKELGAVGVDLLGGLADGGVEGRRVVHSVESGGRDFRAAGAGVAAGDYEAEAALGAGLVVVDDLLGHVAGGVHTSAEVHGGHDYAVLYGDAANFQGLKQLGILECHDSASLLLADFGTRHSDALEIAVGDVLRILVDVEHAGAGADLLGVLLLILVGNAELAADYLCNRRVGAVHREVLASGSYLARLVAQAEAFLT